MGLHKEGNILYVNPVIPSNWDGYTMQYRYLETQYRIDVRNPDHVSRNVRQVKLDGQVVDGNAILLTDDRVEHYLEVIMGD